MRDGDELVTYAGDSGVNALRLLRIRDIDLTRNLIVVHGKGAKTAVLPLGFQEFRDRLRQPGHRWRRVCGRNLERRLLPGVG